MARKPSQSTDDKIKELIDGGIADAVQDLEGSFAWSLERCESPIEKLFAAAVIHPTTTSEYFTRIDLLSPRSGLIADCHAPPYAGIFMWQQIMIDQYRVDFLFDVQPSRGLPKLIVECDGHDFHEKTKEQAQRDKARDRTLVAHGFRLLRFTGSEIYRDPFGAAAEAIAVLCGMRV